MSFEKAYIPRHQRGCRCFQRHCKSAGRLMPGNWGELELETKTGREMSMLSIMSSQLHLQCFNWPVALHTLYSRNKEVEAHLLGKEVGVS